MDDQEHIEQLRTQSARAAFYLDKLPEEQLEAMFLQAFKYDPASQLERIASFSKEAAEKLGVEVRDKMLASPWFLEAMDTWDTEQQAKNTSAFVDELHAAIPPSANVSKEEVLAYGMMRQLELRESH